MSLFAAMSDEKVLLDYYTEESDECADLAFAEIESRFRERMLLSITQTGYNRRFIKLFNKPGLEGKADELVTEALLRVAETRGRPSVRWKPGRASVSAWIFGILRNTVISFLRKKRDRLVTDADVSGGSEEDDRTTLLDSTADEGLNPEEAMQHEALLVLLRECLAEMPKDLRVIHEMLFQRRMKQTEIAKALKLSEPTLTRRKKEATDLLRDCLRRKGIAEDLFE